MALPEEMFLNKNEMPYSSNQGPNLSLPLEVLEDPSLSFDQGPIVTARRPPGVQSLAEWGEIKLPEGKWKGHSFSEAFVHARSQVCELHGWKCEAGLTVGPQLSPVLSSANANRAPIQGEEDRAGTCSAEAAASHAVSNELGSQTKRLGSDLSSLHSYDQSRNSEEKCCRGGREEGYDHGNGRSDQRGEDAEAGSASARDGSHQEGNGRTVREGSERSNTWKSTVALSQDLCLQIEYAQLTIEKE